MRTLIASITDKGYVRHSEPEADDESRLRDIIETRQFPGTMSDREFFAGHGTLADQFKGEEKVLEKVVSEARRQGYNPNPNDVYVPRLAMSIGDPAAFVSPTGGRGQIKKVCQMRDKDCFEADGKVINRRSRYREPDQTEVKLAPDIAMQAAFMEAKNNPEKRRMKKQDLIAEAIDKHGAK